MPTTLGFKDILDLPEWRPIANAPTTSAAGVCLISDKRNNEDRHPEVFQLGSNTVLNKYSVKNDEWMPLASPALAGTFGAGAASVFVPHAGPNGAIGAGATTTSVAITIPVFAGAAASPSIGANMLANRGDGVGFKIRIIGNAAGSSGKIEERYIIGNTGGAGGAGGTAITVYLNAVLSFTPANTDTYEILSGRVYLLGAGTTAAGTWKFYDVATNSYSGNLATTNLPATIGTDSALLSLSELHVPNTRAPSEGFFGNLISTGIGASSLTGQAAGGDATVAANEYRNFQIRIVQDTANPQAVGQRRRISSHTGPGASPVYTLSAVWTSNPTIGATYVIEGWSDCILLWSSGVTTTFNYGIAANAWDTTTWAVRGSGAVGAGCCAEWAYGVTQDANKLVRYSYIFCIRGAATSQIDIFDIAGAATGAWTSSIIYGNSGQTFTTGTTSEYEPATLSGKYFYVNVNGTQRFARFDMLNRVLEPYAYLEYVQGTAVVGDGMTMTLFIDGAVKLAFLIFQRRTYAECFQLALQR